MQRQILFLVLSLAFDLESESQPNLEFSKNQKKYNQKI